MRAAQRWRAVTACATAQVFVGGSVAVSALLSDAPLFTAQAIRYAFACLLLLGMARFAGRPVSWPRGREWGWLIGVVGTGIVVFNVALVRGSEHAEPAVLGVAVACVPILLALIGPILEGSRPTPAAVLAAVVVTVGAALVQGLGRADAIGLGWAFVVFACETGFTLFAVPVLLRIGPWGVSVHTTWLSAVVFAVIAVIGEGPEATTRLRADDVWAMVYLAVAVTALAFVLWYSGVHTLGSGRAGLLTGIAPIAAAGVGVLLGAPAPRPLVWLGIAVVAVGLAFGLGVRRPRASAREAR